MAGYVKLYREAEDHPVFDDPWLWKVFCWCIMRANYKDGRDSRGSFTTGRFRAAEQLRATPSRVYEAWQRLERLGCITVKADSQCTTITVCNYSTYQSDDESKQQQSNNEATAKQQQSNNEATQIERREEWKKGNNIPPKPPRGRRVVDRNYSADFLAFWAAFPGFRKGGKPVAWDAWQKAILRKPACEIIAAASEYASSPLGRSEYAQGPAPWLNQDRWDDDRAMWRRALPGAAPVKRQKSQQEIEESLRYEIVTLGKRAGKSPEQINADLLARGLKP